ncbi:hypothetical protein C8Q79DRAFT_757152 [Trametes meyenii]|nr:hypothetical protein C8Q79DRAFT_757152 [Trametes meyenii]
MTSLSEASEYADPYPQLHHPSNVSAPYHAAAINNTSSLRGDYTYLTDDPHNSVRPANVLDIEQVVLAIQRDFDNANRHIEAQLHAYRQYLQPSKYYSCGICFEGHSEDHIARIGPCGHTYCMECLTGWVTSKIEERRYPILCPQCMVTSKNTGAAPSEIIEDIVQQLQLTDRQYGIYKYTQMSMFSVMVECRRCRQASWVDKGTYRNSDTIKCPSKGCGYVWCKDCSQPINVSGPKHSCDGTSELNDLMKAKKWKRCPGCKTPMERTTGCNYMMCIVPGCEMEFCYACGVSLDKHTRRGCP